MGSTEERNEVRSKRRRLTVQELKTTMVWESGGYEVRRELVDRKVIYDEGECLVKTTTVEEMYGFPLSGKTRRV